MRRHEPGPCGHCGEPKSAGRGTCGARACIAASNAANARRTNAMRVQARVVIPSKTCKRDGCGNVLTIRRHEGPTKFAARDFCCHACGIANRRAECAPKTCKREGCENVLTRRDREGHAKFAGRNYCSPACGLACRKRPAPAPKQPPAPRARGAKDGARKVGDAWRSAPWKSTSTPLRANFPEAVRLTGACNGDQIEAAVRRLRCLGFVVWPSAVSDRPHEPCGSRQDEWMVDRKRMPTADMLAFAARLG